MEAQHLSLERCTLTTKARITGSRWGVGREGREKRFTSFFGLSTSEPLPLAFSCEPIKERNDQLRHMSSAKRCTADIFSNSIHFATAAHSLIACRTQHHTPPGRPKGARKKCSARHGRPTAVALHHHLLLLSFNQPTQCMAVVPHSSRYTASLLHCEPGRA